MKQLSGQSRCFLNEQGVTITSTRLIAPSHTFEFAKIKSVRIMRDKRLIFLLFGRKSWKRLMVTGGLNKIPVVVFETQDAKFMDRVEEAMNQVAAVAKGEKVS